MVANGPLPDGVAQLETFAAVAALRVAADGGARHFLAAGLLPHFLVGDLDSLPASDLDALQKAGVAVLRHPARKDATDLELALDVALAQGADEVVVLAALGARWDQTLANMLLLALERYDRVPMCVVAGAQTLRVLRPGRAHQLAGASGDTLSLIPIAGPAAGITTSGLDYPMKHGTLPFGATLGVSNVLTSATASVTLESGLLLADILSAQLKSSNRLHLCLATHP